MVLLKNWASICNYYLYNNFYEFYITNLEIVDLKSKELI